MATFFDATLQLARLITGVAESSITAVGAGNFADSSKTSDSASYLLGGTVWILSGELAGNFYQISNFEPITGTFTLRDFPQPNPLIIGDLYAAAPVDYPTWLLKQSVNMAYQELSILAKDETLTTVGEQEAYDLPPGVMNLCRVEIGYSIVPPYMYVGHYHWKEEAGKLYFTAGLEPWETGYKMRLTYPAKPDPLVLPDDEVNGYYHPDLLAWESAVYALRWRRPRSGSDEPTITAQLNEALVNARIEAGRHPLPDIRRDPKYAGW